MVNRIRNGETAAAPPAGRKQRASLLSRALPRQILAGRDQKYRDFFEDAILGMWQMTGEGRFFDANDALAHILGYDSRDELISTITDIGHQIHVDPERRDEFLNLLEEHGSIKGFEAQVYRKDGTIIWLAISARVLEPGHAPARYEGIAEDITDRKAIEEALRSSEERFHKAFHASPAAKSIVSADGRRFVDVNDQFLAMLGYSRDEVVGHTADELDIWANAEDRDRIRQGIESAGIVRDMEATLRTKDGALRKVLGSAVTIHVEGDLCVLALLYDITERKRAEEALQESERRYRELIDALGVAVYMTDAEGHITFFNDAAVELWGRRPELGIDQWCGSWRIYDADGTPLPLEDCPMAILLKENRASDAEIIIERPDGSRRNLLPHPSPLRDAYGNVRGAVNLLVDITERKKAEAALSDREARMAAILNTAADGIISIDSSGVIQAFNAAASQIFGYTEAEVIGQKVNVLMPAPYTDEHDSYLERYRETGEAKIIGIGREIVGRRKDGSSFPLELSVSEVKVGGVTTFTGIIRDISERKRIEASLWEEQQRLGLAMQAGRMGAWEWDIDGGAIRWSETLEAIHGLAPGTFGGTFEHYLSDVHPDDKERLLSTITHSLETGTHDVEYRIIRPDGTERWVSAKGQLLRDPSGKPQRMIGLCMDVTDRKRAEEAERFLSEASVMLAATSTDLAMTLASIARIAVPHFGDLCAVSIIDEHGEIKQAAINHRDPKRMKLVRILEERYPFDPNEPFGVAKVLRTGESEFYPHIPATVVEGAARNAGHLKLLRRLGIKSGMAVPLVARGRTLGALTLAITDSSRRYTEGDLAVAEDLGRRAGLALDNAALYVDLEKALEAKDEFLGLMSHELRTPITTIYGGARMIRSRGDRLDDEQKDRLVADIEQESERLFRMVEDLLALARVELGQAATTEPLLMQRLVEKVATTFCQRRSSRTLELHIEQDLPAVAAQPVYVEQVLRNLLSNADKYSPAGLGIDIRVRRGEGGVEVSVLDRGSGVAPEETEQIFERFYRSGAAPRLANGAGLGLTVCKRLIEAQAGHVWAHPNEFGGLEVGFTLPIYEEDV
jgi:PAS domain S-box-containing protein